MNATYDVVVIGAGTAGVPCAVEAAAAGARVLLLERSDRIGGTLSVSGAHLSAAGARRQRARGVLGDTPQTHFEDVVRITGDTVRHDLLRQAVELAPGTVDWLEDNGFEFDERSPFLMLGHEPYSVARTYAGKDLGRSVVAVFQKLVDQHVAQGRLELAFGARASGLVSGPEGVSGLVYDQGGQRHEVRSEHVVLACGGYVGDHERFARLHGRPLTSVGLPTSTGDALTLTEPLGVRPVNVEAFLPTLAGLIDPTMADGWARWADARPRLHTAFRRPWEIYVDRRGQRFVAEDHANLTEKQRALHTLPDLTFFVVFDEEAVRDGDPVVAGWDADGLRTAEATRPGIHSGWSLAELADRAGIDAKGLEQTIGRYNAAVARGCDEEFGRRYLPAPVAEAPFHALEVHGIALDTFAGVDITADFQVRSTTTGPVPGLYAVGEAIGAAAMTGTVVCGGMLVTPCISFGRELGRRLGAHSYVAHRSVAGGAVADCT